MLTRQQYRGAARGLVLAFDVGTTYSGVSYAILDPGEIPKIRGVNRYTLQLLSLPVLTDSRGILPKSMWVGTVRSHPSFIMTSRESRVLLVQRLYKSI